SAIKHAGSRPRRDSTRPRLASAHPRLISTRREDSIRRTHLPPRGARDLRRPRDGMDTAHGTGVGHGTAAPSMAAPSTAYPAAPGSARDGATIVIGPADGGAALSGRVP